MRDGRYVVPVKANTGVIMPGIIHDQSLPAELTLFIEPQVIVTLNNELRQLELDEKAEIETDPGRTVIQCGRAFPWSSEQSEDSDRIGRNSLRKEIFLQDTGEEPEMNDSMHLT